MKFFIIFISNLIFQISANFLEQDKITIKVQIDSDLKSVGGKKINAQPIIINGGNMPALHVFHQPLWLPTVVRNTIEDWRQVKSLQELSDKVDAELQQQNAENGKNMLLVGGKSDDASDLKSKMRLMRQERPEKKFKGQIPESFLKNSEADSQIEKVMQESNDTPDLFGSSGDSITPNHIEAPGAQEAEARNNDNPPEQHTEPLIESELSDPKLDGPDLVQNESGSESESSSEEELPPGSFQQKIIIGDNVENPNYSNQISSVQDIQRFKQDNSTKKQESPKASEMRFKEQEKQTNQTETEIKVKIPALKNQTEQQKIDKEQLEKLLFGNKKDTSKCVRKEGKIEMLESSKKGKPQKFFAILNHDHFSYFLNDKDRGSIQGSIEIGIIKSPVQQDKDHKCIMINTQKDIQNCKICFQDEVTSQEWLSAIQTNIKC